MALTKISRGLLATGVSDSSDATAITIDSNEKVGIGTTSPLKKLNVVDATALQAQFSGYSHASAANNARPASGSIRLGNGDGTTGLLLDYTDQGQTVGLIKNEYIADATSELRLQSPFLSFYTGTSASERMRIDSSGKVGIGTSSPSRQLTVFHTSNATLDVKTSDANLLFNQAGHNAYIGNSSASGFLQLFTNNGNSTVTIDSSGNLIIGASTTRTGTQSLSLEQANSYIQFRQTGAQGVAQIQFMRNTDSTATYAGGISTTGTTVTYSVSSDYRLKENVDYNFNALDRVKQLKPARFNFITDADTTVDGFIAHEVSDIVPEAITGEKDGEEMQGIDQSKLVPLLTKAIQELSAKVEELESKINE